MRTGAFARPGPLDFYVPSLDIGRKSENQTGMTMTNEKDREIPAEDIEDTLMADEAADEFAVLEKLMKEVDDLKDQNLRLAAEMENLRRRTARDVQDARTYAVSNFARDMLAVSDNLNRATEAVGSGEAGLKSLFEGVKITERAMLSALERHGVKKLAPEGEKFDPNFHQAMFEVPNPDVPTGTVVQVVQTGYSIGDRVLRPAMVGVSTGGPKAAPANANEKAEPGPVDEQAEKDA